MKIIFVCKHDYYLLYREIAKLMRETEGINAYAVSFNARTTKILERGGEFDKVFCFSAYMRSRLTSTSEVKERIRGLDESLGGGVFSRAFSIDRLLFPIVSGTIYRPKVKFSYDRILDFLCAGHDFWTELIDKEKPDFIVSEIGNSNEYIGWHLAKRKGVRTLKLITSRIFRDRVFFVDNPVDNHDLLKNTYESLKSKDLTKEKISRAEDFLNTYLKKREKPAYFQRKTPFSLDFSRSMRIVQDIIHRSRVGIERDEPYYRIEDKDELTLTRLVFNRISKAARMLSAARIASSELPGKDFFFFPLHVQPEISTLTLAPFYDNQLAVIENICKSLPPGYVLAVKDHPVMMGRRTRWFYKEIVKFPNAMLVGPSVDSHTLIEKSSGVVTITGTAGLEGILYGKPVVLLGDNFFSFFENARKISGFSELNAAFNWALNEYRADKEMILKFLVAMYDVSYEGYYVDFLENPSVLEAENIEKFAKALITEAKRVYA